MRNSNLVLIERVVREMQIRNYSERTVQCYSKDLSKLMNHFDIPGEQITISQFKDYLHRRITMGKVSTSVVNQSISAFKILQTDILGRVWEAIKIKRPRRVMKLPVVLSLQEVEALISATLNLTDFRWLSDIVRRQTLCRSFSAKVRLWPTEADINWSTCKI